MSAPDERTGVLVLRAWLEHEGSPLRVRITARIDLASAEESTQTLVGAEAASSAVREWLLRFEGDQGPPPRSTA